MALHSSEGGGRRVGKWLLAKLVVLALFAAGCSSRIAAPSDRSTPPDLNTLARRYIRLGLALAERDPDSLDFYIGPQAELAQMHRTYLPLDRIRAEAGDLEAQMRLLPSQTQEDRLRTQFLLLQLTAMETRVRTLRGESIDFDTEARLLFDVGREEEGETRSRDALRAQIRGELRGAPGVSTAARFTAFERKMLVGRDRLPAVMMAALGACRDRTLEHLAMPAGEHVEIEYVRNKTWNAFSRYEGGGRSRLEINTDYPVTIDRVLELACHEGYPGHHVFNTLRDASLVRAKGWPEFTIELTFSPQSFVSEAAAAYAPRLAFSPAERADVEAKALAPLAGLSPAAVRRYAMIAEQVRRLSSAGPEIAREYIDGRLEFVRAQQRLEDELLMEHGEITLLYLNEYRSYMLAYTQGERRIAAEIEKQPGDEEGARWSRYLKLMQSPVHAFGATS